MSRVTAARLDRDLSDLPEGMRWREWMLRAEAAIFASAKPVSRETLARLVGDACRLDALLADINEELKGRPYEIVFVAGGWQFRTRPRHAETLRALAGAKDAGPPSFTKLEMLALSAIAYQQPVTRAELSRLAGHDISRDILGQLKSLGVIAPGPRAPMPGAPIAWVTTARFLEMFSLGSLRDLPELDTIEDAGALGREIDDTVEAALDDALGLAEEESAEDSALDETKLEAWR
ncbi:SMC-Scp complex subunit ScpB [Methylocystis echinoides]|uniref:Transcriptional regulator n=1 Tax=Methylocystis echinoides TaxID=29468 RepID=A0A9W6LU22_9HYPH|nr:SMC-Scp complex subunit ScpB [Methylocystis echinoides]RTL85970.1 MAG: SMC-Scp complex subunit ScpB [Hyphomicrobiales bacterium]GLI95092.1 transcriptional regulator [Methylocystis echinoides]